MSELGEIAIVLRSSPTPSAPIIIINYRYGENLRRVNSSRTRIQRAVREKSHERTNRITRDSLTREKLRGTAKSS